LLLNNYLDKLGVSVTIKVRSTTVNDYGDVTDDYTDHTTTAIIEENVAEVIFAPEGEIVAGDAIGIFKPEDGNYLADSNQVVANNKTYRIMNVTPERVGSEVVYYTVSLKKM